VRAGSAVPKQFRELGGKTVLERTVSKIMQMPDVAGVVVALPACPAGPSVDETRDITEHVRERLRAMCAPGMQLLFAVGGETRQESVYAALKMVPAAAPWVVVHDTSRPFCSESLFERVVSTARERGAAICAVTPADTVKTVTNPPASGSAAGVVGCVESTLDRESLASVQTPQAFEASLLRQAHQAALAEGFTGTDDSQLVERLGHEVAVVQGERSNLKITYPEDFALARALEGEERGSGASQVVGLGFDVHPLAPGRKCVIGGVDIPHEQGLVGHSDADVLSHAVMDAVLGALGKGDIGQWFPNDDPRYRGASSIGLMAGMWEALKGQAEVVNVDAVVIAEAPKVIPHSQEIRRNIAEALGAAIEQVSVKATTAERLGTIGRGEGIAAFCVATLRRLREGP
jgi:2-C-methyl-D-erythritol 2,4-cyclodiphosphate synthase/2-C-methyl-D-erythritol 4-phosphate cytidylyltransferase